MYAKNGCMHSLFQTCICPRDGLMSPYSRNCLSLSHALNPRLARACDQRSTMVISCLTNKECIGKSSCMPSNYQKEWIEDNFHTIIVVGHLVANLGDCRPCHQIALSTTMRECKTPFFCSLCLLFGYRFLWNDQYATWHSLEQCRSNL